MSEGDAAVEGPARPGVRGSGAQAGLAEQLGGRLVVVSNRVGPIRDAARAGGLAVALVDTLRATGGMWFGWSGAVVDYPPPLPHVAEHGRITVATLDLAEDEYERYYNGFANGVLWPLFHYRLDLAHYRRSSYHGYLEVNQRFARALEPMLRPEDPIWVHDFHLFPLAAELRALGVTNRIGFFLHIPFPAPEVLTALPPHREVVESLFHYDLVGFQTGGDLRAFHHYVEEEAGGRVLGDGRVEAFGRTVRAEAFPIGIDADAFRGLQRTRDATLARERLERVLDRRHLVVGVDRLDYSKGLPERFRAWERFLRDHPEERGRVSYIQIAPPSRGDVEEYIRIRRELEALAGSINSEYSEFDWTPLRYINRAYSRRAISGIFQIARVGLVTPLRDGMNLVAKEYVAGQRAEDPGVLILSRFAGAAQAAPGALIVNPYDIQEVADAIARALVMPLEERKERWNGLYRQVRRHDVHAWSRSFLMAMAAAGGTDEG